MTRSVGVEWDDFKSLRATPSRGWGSEMDYGEAILMFCVDAKTITRAKMIKVEKQVSVAWGRFIWGENCTRGWDISVQHEKPPALAPALERTVTLSTWNVMCYWFEVADLYQPELTGVFVSLQDESASFPALCVSLCCSDPSSLLTPPPHPPWTTTTSPSPPGESLLHNNWMLCVFSCHLMCIFSNCSFTDFFFPNPSWFWMLMSALHLCFSSDAFFIIIMVLFSFILTCLG